MTAKEAIQAMLDGNKITCKKFDDFYVYFDGECFRDKIHDYVDFCDIYDNYTGWELYEEPKQKQTVVIERWLCEYCGGYVVVDGNDLTFMRNEMFTKIKLLDTYEVTL